MIMRKIKSIRIATILFLAAIAAVTCFVIEDHDIIDIGYLIVLIVFFVKYLCIQHKNKGLI